MRVGCLRLLPTSGHGAWARQGPSSLGSAAVWESCGCSQARRGGEATLPRPRGRGSVLRGRGRGLRGDLSLWLAGPLVCGDLAQAALRGPSSPAPWKRLPRARDRVCTRAFGSRESRLLLSSGRRVMRSGTLSPRRGPENRGGAQRWLDSRGAHPLLALAARWPASLCRAWRETAAGTSAVLAREGLSRRWAFKNVRTAPVCRKPSRRFVSRVCGLPAKPVRGRFQLPSESWDYR